MMTLALRMTSRPKFSSEPSALATTSTMLVPKSTLALLALTLTLSLLLIISPFEKLGALNGSILSLDRDTFALSFFVVGCWPVVTLYGQFDLAQDLRSFQFFGLNIRYHRSCFFLLLFNVI